MIALERLAPDVYINLERNKWLMAYVFLHWQTYQHFINPYLILF
jgi:hypothetical protein